MSSLRRRLSLTTGPRGEPNRSDDLVPAIVVPDESAWLLWGRDLRRFGFAAVPSPLAARVLVAPSRVPEGLADAVAGVWRQLPEARQHIALDDHGIDGLPLEEVLAEAEASGGARAGESEKEQSRHEDPGAEGHGHHGGGQAGEDPIGGDEAHAGHPRTPAPPPDVDVPPIPEHPPAPDEPGRADHDLQRAGDEQHNMMPVEGEPSTDGLVMEPVEVELGPLGAILPGGLVARVVLDGDVIAACSLEAALSTHPSRAAGAFVPDPLAPAAWREATSVMQPAVVDGPGSARGWASLVEVEVERSMSHVVWLRALGGLLGWEELADAAHATLRPFLDARALRPRWTPGSTPSPPCDPSPAKMKDALIGAAGGVERLRRLLGDSRRLARRTRGRGKLDAAAVEVAGVGGPIARGAGIRVDERLSDPRYAELGFEPVLCDEGDALARTRVRLEEARHAVGLARAALERVSSKRARDPDPRVDDVDRARRATAEGPRGPVQVSRASGGSGFHFTAPGQEALLELAGQSAVEEEWSAGLVAIVSFDLSPWQVSG